MDKPNNEHLKHDALERLDRCQKSDDQEAAHVEADDVLCDLLIELGFGDVVSAYHRIPKWYA